MSKAFFYFLVCFLQIENARTKFEGFVVGGDFTNIKQHPHSAYMSIACNERWSCGSSVLNQQILITAAHCLNGCDLKIPTHRINIYFGHEDLYKATLIRIARSFIMHKDHDEKSLENDIGLVLMRKAVPFGETVKRVIISRTFPQTGYKGIMAGWGLTGQNSSSRVFKHVYQQPMSMNTCKEVKLHLGMYCAGHASGQSYPSSGDSGSGLVTLKDTYNLIGLVSFRISIYTHFVVYTNITYYYKWIEKNTQSLYCQI